MEEDKTMQEKVLEKVEEKINSIVDVGLQVENIDNLYKLIDIHKDLKNEEYWKEKIDMRYYGNYGEDYGRRMRDSRGRYMEGNYGRRGVDTKYRQGDVRGDRLLDEMYQGYGEYNEGREQYGRGNYGAKEDSMKSLQYMLQAMEDFGMYLMEDAETEEERNMIKQTLRKMGEQ